MTIQTPSRWRTNVLKKKQRKDVFGEEVLLFFTSKLMLRKLVFETKTKNSVLLETLYFKVPADASKISFEKYKGLEEKHLLQRPS